MLLDPPYRDYHVELGEVSSYPPGYKENAGIFCHNNSVDHHRRSRLRPPAERLGSTTARSPPPISEISEIHRLEPYVYAQMIAKQGGAATARPRTAGSPARPRGTSSALSQWICGIRAEHEGLRVEPRLPDHVKKARITRRFRGCEYVIDVVNRKSDGAIVLKLAAGRA